MEKQRIVIAIVDDDPGMRASLEALISIFGYRTEVYSSAEEFVRAAITTEASCIVIDSSLAIHQGSNWSAILQRLALPFQSCS